jgi:biopolymer transport protein ExbD
MGLVVVVGCTRPRPARATMTPPSQSATGTAAESVVTAVPGGRHTLVIDALGAMSLDGVSVRDELELEARARAIAAGEPGVQVVVAADRSVRHARVVAAIGGLRRGGVTRMAMMVAPPP